MKAIILAAGKGVRLQPLTNDRPKQMVQVLGRPIIDYILELLPEEITELIFVVGYKGEMIKEYLGAAWHGLPITYIEQAELKGPFAAVALAKPYLNPEERFLVIFADDFYDKASFRRLLRHPRAVLVHEVEHPERFGIVIANADGTISDIEEKPTQPKSNLAVTGAYILDKHFFEYEPEAHTNGEYYFPPVIMQMIKEYPMYVEKAEVWLPIGYPEDVARAEAMLRDAKGEMKESSQAAAASAAGTHL